MKPTSYAWTRSRHRRYMTWSQVAPQSRYGRSLAMQHRCRGALLPDIRLWRSMGNLQKEEQAPCEAVHACHLSLTDLLP